jgi:hypothetical protein
VEVFIEDKENKRKTGGGGSGDGGIGDSILCYYAPRSQNDALYRKSILKFQNRNILIRFNTRFRRHDSDIPPECMDKMLYKGMHISRMLCGMVWQILPHNPYEFVVRHMPSAFAEATMDKREPLGSLFMYNAMTKP